jgi:hypothetical protein
MNDQIHTFVTNPAIAACIVGVLLAGWFKYQHKKSKVVALDNTFIMRNVLFVSVLVAGIVYFGQPLPPLEESMFVAPADF